MSYDLSSSLASALSGVSGPPTSPTPDPAGSAVRGAWWETAEVFRIVWNATEDALALSDRQGIVLAANPAYYQLYGYTPAEVLGQDFALIFPEDIRDVAREQYKIAFAQAEIDPVVASVIRRKDGTLRAVETRYGFITQHGERTAMLSTIRDVTHSAQTQAALEAARQRAAAALQTRDEVFSLVTHDLKNPLTAIKGLAQLLKRQAQRAAAVDDAAQRAKLVQGLDRIDELATKMTAQINDLLDLGRREESVPSDPAPQPTDLCALVQQKVEEFQRVAPQHSITFTAAVPELIGPWDAPGLERVLDNLLSNAIKYSPGGGPIGVQVTRELLPQEDPAALPVGAQAVLTVSDQGIGIPVADLPYIFDRYRRAGNVGPTIAGTGLGLAAVRQIVEQHRGTIAVQSDEGAGTTFTVCLPL
jgi:PAS domain S-box-containing protein